MPKYKLHYFAINGRAVIPRAILSYAKADWENSLIQKVDWPKIKKSGLCEYEQLPILEVDDKKYSQSQAINLYLGETFKLMGKDIEEKYQITNLLMTFPDFIGPMYTWIFCQEEEKKPELHKAAEDKLNFFIGKFEKKYVDLGKGKYYLGDKFTLADIFLATVVPSAIDGLHLKENPCKTFGPNLDELIKRVRENELKEFFEKFYFK